MKIDIKDIKFWMDAIRNSEDRYRTLESFWGGQLQSKTWLIEFLEKRLSSITNSSIVIHGGWNGVLASMLFNSNIGVKSIVSVDIDPLVRDTALMVNKRQEMEGRFKAVTSDMCEYNYDSVPTVIINTSCEHITQKQYDEWLSKVPYRSTIVLQSNNYYDLKEHINCSKNLDEFKKTCGIEIEHSAELEMPNVEYKRFMIIGRKEHVRK